MEFFEFSNAALNGFFSYGASYTKAFPLALALGAIIFLLVYIFKAIGLYTIAKREGYKNRWMAFIPFFNTYYIGVLSDKNTIRRVQPKKFSFALAIVEAVLTAMYLTYFILLYILLYGGYIAPQYSVSSSIYGSYVTYDGLGLIVDAASMTTAMYGAYVTLSYLGNYFISIVNIAFVLLDVMVLIAFFQTYASRRYIIMSLFSAIFPPVQGILMFVVRNNKGKNYMDYVREQREKQYRMYQEYNRQNMNGNPYNGYNPYTGRPYTPPQDNPYESNQPKSSGVPEDPFAEFGSGDNSKDDGDPFEDFKH